MLRRFAPGPFVLAALALLVASGSSGAAEPKGLDIYYVDVMGGAATLIVTPERESILVDSGWPGLDDRDPKRIEYVLKEVAGLEHLDHLITTHWHMDHYGGVEGLARRLEIKRFWDRGLPEDGLVGLDFPDGPAMDDPLGIAYRKASAGKRTVLKPGDRLPLKGDVTLDILASGTKVVDLHAKAPNTACDESIADLAVDGSDNARSIVFRLSHGAFDFLDAGDLTWNIEKALVCPVDKVGPIDLYQVTHHGMDISNHPTLVRTIAPTVAIMNNGPRKGGAPATFRLLKGTPSVQALYALHRNQQTAPEENADPALTANDDATGGQFIQVNVSPDGSSYRVRIGVDGSEREFTSK